MPVWRTEHGGQGYVATGYYCWDHVPDDRLPPDDCDPIEVAAR